MEVISMNFTGDRLSLICIENGNLILKELDMYSKVSTGNEEIYLDDLVQLPTDGINLTLPDNYNADDVVLVRGVGTDYELNLVGALIVGRTVTLEESIGPGTVVVGRIYRSSYIPTRPFVRDEEGQPVTTDPLRIGKYILAVQDTNTVKMNILSDYYEGSPQVFNGRILGQNNSMLGSIPFYSGDVKFPFSQNADYALAEFVCDNHLGCTITNISWEGQYFKSKRRI